MTIQSANIHSDNKITSYDAVFFICDIISDELLCLSSNDFTSISLTDHFELVVSYGSHSEVTKLDKSRSASITFKESQPAKRFFDAFASETEDKIKSSCKYPKSTHHVYLFGNTDEVNIDNIDTALIYNDGTHILLHNDHTISIVNSSFASARIVPF